MAASNPRPTSFPRSADRAASAANSLVRAILATGRAHLLKASSTEVLKDTAPGDRLASAFLKVAGLDDRQAAFDIVERAAVLPASMGTANWADTLVGLSLSDLSTFAPSSAASAILKRCLVLEFGRQGVAVVPRALIAPGATTWIGEGAAIPSRSFALAADTLTPNKLATLTSFTRELFEGSQPVVENVLRTVINETLSLDLDVSFFGNAAASADRPAGILEGLVATPASVETGDAGMIADLTSLLVGPAAIAPDVVLVAAPPQAIRLRLRPDLASGLTVFASSALTAGTVISIAPSAIAAAMDGAPRWSLSREALIHEEDATPLPVGTEASPATVAAPLRSMWQTDSLSLRMIFEVSWARRHDSAVAFTTGVGW